MTTATVTQQEIDSKIDAFGAALSDALGDTLAAVLVYGSLAKGDYAPEASDHNVAVILADDHAQTLRKVAQVMRDKRPSTKTTLLLMTTEELEHARDVFPLKLRDLCRNHRLVCGSDASLQACALSTQDLARDCEQQLRSLAIRSRRLFLRGTSNPDLLRHNLTLSYKGMLPPLAGLVELETKRAVASHEEILREAAKLLSVDETPLLELHRWHREPSYQPAQSQSNLVLDALMDLLRAGALRADALHRTHSGSEEAPTGLAAAVAASATPAGESGLGESSEDVSDEAVPSFGKES
jgi:predicted nucleotidyltransferase